MTSGHIIKPSKDMPERITSPMLQDEEPIIEGPMCESLVKSLNKTVGIENSKIVIDYLRAEGVIHNGQMDIDKLEIALRRAFASGSFSIISRHFNS